MPYQFEFSLFYCNLKSYTSKLITLYRSRSFYFHCYRKYVSYFNIIYNPTMVFNNSISCIWVIPYPIYNQNFDSPENFFPRFRKEKKWHVFFFNMIYKFFKLLIFLFPKCKHCFSCASAAETCFSVTAESKAMLYIPLQRNTM